MTQQSSLSDDDDDVGPTLPQGFVPDKSVQLQGGDEGFDEIVI
jgi:hypothetical protein